MTRIVLASASPRRHQLLTQIGVTFTVSVPDIDETPFEGEDPVDYVARLAVAKAMAVEAASDEMVIAADTTVDLDGRILGKPVDDTDAADMLRGLSNRTHQTHTGVAVRLGDTVFSEVCSTSVRFVDLDEAAITWYLATGEAKGKAGAYAIQGAAAALISGIDGSVSNVVGLPLHTTVELARRCGVQLVG
jgi:septum formation protein